MHYKINKKNCIQNKKVHVFSILTKYNNWIMKITNISHFLNCISIMRYSLSRVGSLQIKYEFSN